MQSALLEIAIEPKSVADHEKLVAALAQLTAEDSLFGVRTDREAGQIIVTGMGELHLDDKVDVLRRIYKVEANFGALQVAYRERITKQATVDCTYKQQIGGSGRYARVKIACEPLPPGTGFIFENKIVGGAVPQEYLPAVEKGIESVLCSGVLAGFPVVDSKVTLIDGAYHDTDSTAVAFESAARMALREALQKSGAVLLEPIMKVEVVTPQDYSSAVVDDFTARRGQIQSQDVRGNTDVVTTMVPLANMFGYVNALHSISHGRGTYTMQFDHYAEVPLPDDDPPFRPALGMRA